MIFDGAAFCPKCGARRSRALEQESAARCPGCRNELHRVDVGSTPLYECTACDSVWVDADVFERLCADREAQAAVLPRLSPRTSSKPAGPVRYRPCVRCGKMMNRINFGTLSGTVVDVCKGHGSFLDPGELHQIVTFIQGGGLERARARKLEDLRDEQRKLQDLQRRATRESPGHYHVDAVSDSTFDAGAIVDLIDLIKGH
jgi:Zn-finger nucleic acid-binding protein